jgi:hypothetical protein
MNCYKNPAQNGKLYGGSGSILGGVTPSNLIFQADYNTGSLTPELGSSPTFSRASSLYVPNDSGDEDFALFTTGVPAVPTRPYKSSALYGGYFSQGGLRNYCLQSNNLATTPWDVIGSPTVANDEAITNIYGDANTCSSLEATGDDDGVFQSTSVTAASKKCIFRVFVKSVSGDVDGQIQIYGSTGGTPEVTTVEFTATDSEWTVVEPTTIKTFTASATGNITVNITLDNAGDAIYIDGCQLEIVTGTNRNGWNRQAAYLPTTTAQVAAARDALSYDSSGFESALAAGTMMTWCATPGSTIVGGAPTILSIGADDIIMFFSPFSVLVTRYGTNVIHNKGISLAAGVWHHYAYTWDQPNDDYNLYIDGALIANATPTHSISSGGNLNVGWSGTNNDTGRLWGWVDGVKVYNAPLPLSSINAIYTNESSNYS